MVLNVNPQIKKQVVEELTKSQLLIHNQNIADGKEDGINTDSDISDSDSDSGDAF